MAIIVTDSVSIKGLRKSHFTQLLDYLRAREREKWFYDNPKQFEKRHKELKSWLEGIIGTYL